MKFKNLSILLIFLFSISNCTLFKKNEDVENSNKETIEKKKRINPNVEERTKEARDKGLTIFGKKVGEGGVVSFATSNVMWRASLEVLDFMPIESVDYGGGVIVTDWYKKNISEKEEIKIRIQFLSNELAPSSIKILSHKKICTELSNCKIVKANNIINKEIKKSIINKARELKIADEKKTNK